MNFDRGDLVMATDRDGLGSAVWDPGLSRGLDTIQIDEVVLVVESPNASGWTYVMTPRGIQGYVHKNNLRCADGARVIKDRVY